MEERYSFCVKLAGLVIKISAKYDFCKKMCKDYILPSPARYDFEVSASDREIEAEKSAAENAGEDRAEFVCIYRKIADVLPRFSCAVFHGAAISYKKQGVLFTAKSGTGKTTHIKLWRKYFGPYVEIINGDKPIIKLENKKAALYGTPWAGKENFQKNRSAALKTICIIAQSRQNKIERLKPEECIETFLGQIYLPKEPRAMENTLKLLNELISAVPVYKLYCDISREAADLSFNTIIGK